MKKILRGIASYSVALYIASVLYTGLHVVGGLQTFILAGVLLAASYMILKPILSVISLPLNVLTLGIFSWILVTGLFFAMTKLNSNITVVPFSTYPLNLDHFHLPSFHLNAFLSYFVISATIYVLANAIEWIFGE